MPRNRSITGQKWAECDICGFDYPLPQMGVNTAGLVVCFEKCFDASKFVYPVLIAVSAPPVSLSGQYLTTADGTPITDADGNLIYLL